MALTLLRSSAVTCTPITLFRPRGIRTLVSSSSSAYFQPTKTRTFICDNPGSVDRACQVLRDAPYVLFDCEGHNIRSANGSESESVSLVQLGTPHAGEVFIFDMLTLGQKSIRAIVGVLDLLSNSMVLKVGWGGVEDFKSMMRIYGRSITPFLDLQIVDIHSRVRGCERREVQIGRLACGGFPASVVAKLQIDGVHRLNGMDRALVEHGLDDVPLKESHRGRWSERPLASSNFHYAANDIIRISELHDYFKRSRMLSTKILPDAIAQSAIHMQLQAPGGILYLRQRFVPCNILPLDIINISVSKENFFTRNRSLQRCKRCQRALSLDCFPVSRSNGFGPDVKRLELCKACMYHVKKNQYVLRTAAQAATRFVKKMIEPR